MEAALDEVVDGVPEVLDGSVGGDVVEKEVDEAMIAAEVVDVDVPEDDEVVVVHAETWVEDVESVAGEDVVEFVDDVVVDDNYHESHVQQNVLSVL